MIMIWNWILLYSLLLCEVKADNVKLRDNKISISCKNEEVIAIMAGTASAVPHLLEQCNARKECDVPFTSDQSISAQYWCHTSVPTLETKKSSRPILQVREQKVIGVMSEDYSAGMYQAAEIINCNITFEKDSSQTKEINFILYDFASFAKSTTFCLVVEDSVKDPFCSGSQKFYTEYGPFTVESKRQFAIKLADTKMKLTQAPLVRFWFNIRVSRASLGQMECQSESDGESMSSLTRSASSSNINGATLSNSKGKTSNLVIIISSALGAVVLVAVVTLIIVAVCWRRRSNRIKEDDNGYSYIDSKSITKSVNSIWDRENEFTQSIPKTWKEVETVNKVTKEVLLPTKSELRNDLVRSGLAWECAAGRQEHQETEELTGNDDEPKNTEIQASAEEDNDANTDNECSSLDSVQVLNDVGANAAACGPTPLANTQRNTIEVKDEKEVKESRSSQDDHDIAELSVVQQDTEATDAEIQDNTAQDSTDGDDDSVVNEYTSLNPVEPFGDGPRNHAAENTYTVLGNAACGYKIKGVMVGRYSAENPKKSGAECDAMDDSGEENDYLVLLPDDLLESEHSVQAEPLPVNAVGDEAVETLHEEDQKGDIADIV